MATQIVNIPAGQIVNVHDEAGFEADTEYWIQHVTPVPGTRIRYGEFQVAPTGFLDGHVLDPAADFYVTADADAKLYCQADEDVDCKLAISET